MGLFQAFDISASGMTAHVLERYYFGERGKCQYNENGGWNTVP